MNKRIQIMGMTFASSIIIGVCLLSSNKNLKEFKVSSTSSYTLVMDDSVTVTDNRFTLTTNQGTSITMGASNYTPDSYIGTLASSGEIYNVSPLNGLTSVNVTLASGSISLYTGWLENSNIVYSSEAFDTQSGSGTKNFNLSSISPSYYKIVATSQTSLSSLSMTYSCSASTSTSFRLKVNAPIVNSTDDLLNTNYVFINTNLSDVNTWTNYLMTKDSDDGWYYDFDNVVTRNSGYTITLCLSDNTSSPNWSYQSTNISTYGVSVTSGQLEMNIADTPAFTSQPTPAANTYSLTVNLVINNLDASSGNIQFIPNYDDSENYTWETYYLATSTLSSSLSETFSGFDNAQTLYFKVYIWDGTHSRNIRVGGDNGANFSLIPSGRDNEEITITFNFPSVEGNVVGTLENNNNYSSTMSFANQVTTVYGSPITISPVFDGASESFTAFYTGENIRIDNNNTIIGLKAGTVTNVILTSESGLSCSFNVTVNGSEYAATSERDTKWAASEGWFTNNSVAEISTMGRDFYHGIDVSSAKALYDNGTKFYNEDGIEQSLFYILKDAGVNWIRLKLWVDPQTSTGVSYGGGESNLDNTLWMAKEVKAAGMKFLLDFHYSDYWTHPGQQILPKAWKDAGSASALASYIKSYTQEALEAFEDIDCLPDMVQLGNEISSGNFLQKPGSGNSFNAYGEPDYLTGKSNFNYQGTSGSANMVTYLTAASEGVDLVDSSIKKVIHWAKGSTFTAGTINSFYSALSSVDYDYAGLSIYPYYCCPTGNTAVGGGIDTLNSVLSGLSLSKPWFVAETSYPFTGSSYVYENATEVTNFAISDWTVDGTGQGEVKDITTMKANYPFTPAGQAKMIHDLTYSIVRYGGLGVFYWEGAWVPNANVGWAGSGSSCSWSNQGFFSYDGKPIANLNLFAQLSPYID